MLLFSSVALHVLRHRRRADSTLLWLFITWLLPIVGPVFYAMFGVDRVPKERWRRNVQRHVRMDGARQALTGPRAVTACREQTGPTVATELSGATESTGVTVVTALTGLPGPRDSRACRACRAIRACKVCRASRARRATRVTTA